MKEWDIFISYATEDRQAVALPLATALRTRGVRVWLDAFEMRLGDSIRQKIDLGLANSRFGVVVVSEPFLVKYWPKRELDALIAKEERGRKVILPVWHSLTKETILMHAPTLAGILAANTGDGLEVVAARIATEVFGEGEPQPGTRLSSKLASLLGQEVNVDKVRDFLTEDTRLIRAAFALSERDHLQLRATLGDHRIDFCSSVFQPSSGRFGTWNLTCLLSPTVQLFDSDGEPHPALQSAAHGLERLRRWVGADLARARSDIPGISASFHATVVCGRRPQPNTPASELLAEYNDTLVAARVRTFDWLLDVAFELDAGVGREHDR